LHELDYAVSARGWLYSVTRRVAFRYRRSAARTARRKAAVSQRPQRPELPHARLEAAHLLEQLLERIDPTQREAFVMTELLGMSGPEIAGELSVPLNTVYSRLRLARRRLGELAAGSEVIDTAIEAARHDQRPSPRQAERTWAAIAPIVGSPWTALEVGMVSAMKSGWTAVACTVVLGSAVMLSWPGAKEPSASADLAQQAAPAPRSPVPRDAPALRAVPEAQALSDVAVVAPSPTPTLPTRVSQATHPAPSPTDDLAAEVALLDVARTTLDRGDAEAALAHLTELETRFPSSPLLDARSATRVRALCRLGRTTEAAKEAARLHREHPDSNVARRIPASCTAP
jgi:hypothetical protein